MAKLYVVGNDFETERGGRERERGRDRIMQTISMETRPLKMFGGSVVLQMKTIKHENQIYFGTRWSEIEIRIYRFMVL